MVKYTIMNRKSSFFLMVYLILNEKISPGIAAFPMQVSRRLGTLSFIIREEMDF